MPRFHSAPTRSLPDRPSFASRHENLSIRIEPTRTHQADNDSPHLLETDTSSLVVASFIEAPRWGWVAFAAECVAEGTI
jgi:hypothetical protein